MFASVKFVKIGFEYFIHSTEKLLLVYTLNLVHCNGLMVQDHASPMLVIYYPPTSLSLRQFG